MERLNNLLDGLDGLDRLSHLYTHRESNGGYLSTLSSLSFTTRIQTLIYILK